MRYVLLFAFLICLFILIIAVDALEKCHRPFKISKSAMHNLHSQGVSIYYEMKIFLNNVIYQYRTNKECCVCNYNHPKNDLPQLNEKWNWKKHTKQETTNCYGILPRSNSPVGYVTVN